MEIRDQYTLMVKGEKQQFIDRRAVNKYFKENVFNNIVDDTADEEEKDYYVNGFPVDYIPFEVHIKGNTLPLFKKKQVSDVYYAAGYYCIGFPKNWMPGYCPKLTTLESHGYRGPYKTEMEMKVALTRLRKEK
jgi:hypothetical protein